MSDVPPCCSSAHGRRRWVDVLWRCLTAGGVAAGGSPEAWQTLHHAEAEARFVAQVEHYLHEVARVEPEAR